MTDTTDSRTVAWNARIEIATSSMAAPATPRGEVPAASRRLAARVRALLAVCPELSGIETTIDRLDDAGEDPVALRRMWREVDSHFARYSGGGTLWT